MNVMSTDERASRRGRTRGLLAALAATALIGGMTAAASAQDESFDTEGKRIGQVLYSTDSYQVAHARHVEEYAQSLGMSVQTIDGRIDPEVQANAVSDLIAARVDGILYQPVDPAAAAAPIREAQDAGIPIATWAIKPSDEVTTPFLELNEYETTRQAGRNAANAVAGLFPDQPVRMIIIDIPTVPLCSELRMQGFIDGVQEVNADAEVIARVDGAGDRLTATTVMEDLLQRERDFNIVTACNGEMLLGALGALEASGRGQATDKVPQSEYLFSIDGSPAEIAKLVDPGSALMETMTLTPRENGRAFLGILVRMMAGEIGLTEPYTEITGSLLLPPDCDVINTVLQEQFFATEPVACP
jgi:ABC-type sugar transport system substrate-binding protein